MERRIFTQKDTNICKGIAIILMYIHHLFYSVDTIGIDRVEFWLAPKEVWVAWAGVCKVCVSIFVFLTAYGITTKNNYENSDIWRRYRKLMFGFGVVYIDSQILSFFTGRTRVAIYGKGGERIIHSFIDMMGVSYAFGTPTYNPTWWYMSLAVVLVVVIPIFIKVYD